MTLTTHSRELRAIAFAFDAQRGKLPDLTHPHRLPEPVAIATQIRELAALVDQLSRRVLTGVTDETTTPQTHRITGAYARALEPAGRAIVALGQASNQLAFLDQTWFHRHRPDTSEAREAAHAVLEDALTAANAALEDAAEVLHATATWILPTSQRQVAVLSRTTTPGAKPSPTLEPATPPNVSGSTPSRGR